MESTDSFIHEFHRIIKEEKGGRQEAAIPRYRSEMVRLLAGHPIPAKDTVLLGKPPLQTHHIKSKAEEATLLLPC
jgi:hypothetical protein